MDSATEAQILTKDQQKKSISGSKIQKRKVVLNTLDSPMDMDWPRIGAAKEEEIRHLIGIRFFSPIRASNVSLPKSTFSAMSKQEREEWKTEEHKKAKASVQMSKMKMSDVFVGFRDVVKAIGGKQACFVFCEKTPDPPLLTRLLSPLCKNNGIPLCAIKNFGTTVKSLLGIPRCLTIALKLSVRDKSSQLHDFYEKSLQIYQFCGLEALNSDIGPKAATITHDEVVEVPKYKGKIINTPEEALSVSGAEDRFYLKKNDLCRRFIPGLSKNPLKTVDCTDNTISIAADYIALRSEPIPELPSTQMFRPQKIKPLQPNPNKRPKKVAKNVSSTKKSK